MISLKLLFPFLLGLIVVNNESLSIDGQRISILSVLLDHLCSRVLILEAHKSKTFRLIDWVTNSVNTTLSDHDFSVFDITELAEEIFQIFIFDTCRNILDIQVLPLQTLFQSFHSLLLLDCVLNIQGLWVTLDFEAVHLLNSVLSVLRLCETDESESFALIGIVSHDSETSQFSKLLEFLAQLVLSPVLGNILDVQVVHDGGCFDLLLIWFDFVGLTL